MQGVGKVLGLEGAGELSTPPPIQWPMYLFQLAASELYPLFKNQKYIGHSSP